jgi:hypothetical protein
MRHKKAMKSAIFPHLSTPVKITKTTKMQDLGLLGQKKSENLYPHIFMVYNALRIGCEKRLKKVCKIFGGLEKMLYFCPLERWQSGRLRRS